MRFGVFCHELDGFPLLRAAFLSCFSLDRVHCVHLEIACNRGAPINWSSSVFAQSFLVQIAGLQFPRRGASKKLLALRHVVQVGFSRYRSLIFVFAICPPHRLRGPCFVISPYRYVFTPAALVSRNAGIDIHGPAFRCRRPSILLSRRLADAATPPRPGLRIPWVASKQITSSSTSSKPFKLAGNCAERD